MEKKESFKCDMCNKLFIDKVNLNGHVKIVHDGHKPFKCNICQQYFLKNPTRISTLYMKKRKTFECRVCRKRFSNNGNLKKHANALHEENGMIFKYALCAKYKKNDSLTYHISRIHEGLKPLKCEICVAYFTSK